MIQLVVLALEILFILVIARIIVSWLPRGGELLESSRRFLLVSTEWMLAPVRRVVPPLRLGGAALDLSPIIVIIVIQVLMYVLV